MELKAFLFSILLIRIFPCINSKLKVLAIFLKGENDAGFSDNTDQFLGCRGSCADCYGTDTAVKVDLSYTQKIQTNNRTYFRTNHFCFIGIV